MRNEQTSMMHYNRCYWIVLLLVMHASSFRIPMLKFRRYSFDKEKPTVLHAKKTPTQQFFQYRNQLSKPNNNYLEKIREFGATVVESSPIPYGKDEGWRTVEVQTLFNPLVLKNKYMLQANDNTSYSAIKSFIESYTDPLYPNSIITFFDGEFSPALSSHSSIPPHIWATIHDTSKSLLLEHNETIWNMLNSIPHKNALIRESYGSPILAGFNMMNLKDLLFIHLPNFTQLNEPIQIVFCHSNTSAESGTFPRLLVDIGGNCTARIHQIGISFTKNTTFTAVKTLPPQEFQYKLRSDRFLGDLNNPADQVPYEFDESTIPERLYMYDYSNATRMESLGERWLEFNDPTGYFVNSTILKDSVDDLNSTTVKIAAMEMATKEVAEADIIKDAKKRKFFVGGMTQVRVGRGSHLEHIYFQNYARDTLGYEVAEAEVMGDSHYESCFLQVGGKVHRLNAHINLKEVYANATLNGVMICAFDQLSDIHSVILHNHTQTNCKQQERIVVGESGKGVFRGLLRMPAQSSYSTAEQLCRGIMLGDNSRIQAVPALDISSDKIECSHGVAISDLDENEMFYLQSRGFSRMLARAYLARVHVLEAFPLAMKGHHLALRCVSRLQEVSPSNDVADADSLQHLMSL